MTNFSAVDARKKPFLWIDALIDDWGLSPSEMRVYLSVVRRAGSSKCSDGRFFESIGNLAKRLGLSDKTVSRCLKTLVAANIIARCCRAGKTNEYRLMDSSDWKALERESDRPQTGEPEVLMSGNEQKFSTTPDISTVPPRTSRPYHPGHLDRTIQIPESDPLNHFLEAENKKTENSEQGEGKPTSQTSAEPKQQKPDLKAKSEDEVIIPPPRFTSSCENFEAMFTASYPWRVKGTKSSAFIPEFVEYVINHLKSSDHYKERGGANQANAKDWIRRKEKDSEGIESLHDHFEQCKSDLELKLKADKPTESGIPLRAAEGLGVPASPPHQEVTRDNHVARLRVKYQISKMNPQRDAEIKSECEKFGVDFEKEVKPPIPNQ